MLANISILESDAGEVY